MATFAIARGPLLAVVADVHYDCRGIHAAGNGLLDLIGRRGLGRRCSRVVGSWRRSRGNGASGKRDRGTDHTAHTDQVGLSLRILYELRRVISANAHFWLNRSNYNGLLVAKRLARRK